MNLEKRNYDDRSIAALFNKQGILLTSQEDILALEREYYVSQHSDQSPVLEDDPYCPPPLSILDDLDRQVLNSDLTEDELEKAMRKMKSGKCDGIPVELYKRFWHILAKPLFNSLLFSSRRGT